MPTYANQPGADEITDERADDNTDPSNPDAELLSEIRERYRYGCDMWREAREERKIDLRYLSGDPWSDEDRKARADAGRPCISHDELNQYVNQAVNSARQSKRGIKIEPLRNGADEHTAELHENLIRAIEYNSRAQSVYLKAFQCCVEGSYGFARVSRRYIDRRSDEQEIIIRAIPNPDAVVYDPDCKEPDWSDAKWCFVLERMSKKEFRKRFPKSKVRDFADEEQNLASDWIQGDNILTAEYWRLETIDTGEKTPGGRPIEDVAVRHYYTNGLEILERSNEPQPGEEIPIVPFIGMERYVDDGSGNKRKLFSLPRLARDPQMSLAYLCSQQMEEAGLTPKTPYIGYVGQFESDAEAWATATKIPHAYLRVDPFPENSNGQLLPLPRRESFTPNFQGYELAKDSCRRAIQAAMGISPLPTAAQRNSEKSGVALERIQTQQAIGSLHFVDGYELAIQRIGRIVESQIPVVYGGSERDASLRKPDDSHQVVRLNTEAPYLPNGSTRPAHYPVTEADHQVTVTTGPSYESQREEAADFLDTLIANLGKLPIAPPQAAKLLSLAIQMKQLGPKGDQMSEIIAPPEGDGQEPLPPQVQQAMQQSQQHLQALAAYAKKLEGELQQLQQEKQAKIVENQGRLEIEKLKIDAQLAMAEINTKSQVLNERIQFVEDVWKQLHGQAHEVGMQAEQQAHERGIAAQQAQAAQAQDSQQQEHDLTLADQQNQAAQQQAVFQAAQQQRPDSEQ
jgi:portal protein